MRARSLLPLLVAMLAGLGACAEETSVCRVASDCASGVCRSDGTCAEAALGQDAGDAGGRVNFDVGGGKDGGGTGKTDVALQQDGAGSDGPSSASDIGGASDFGGGSDVGGGPDGSEPADSEDDTDAPLVCKPNHDGKVTRQEVTLGANLSAPFRIAHDVAVDLVGQPTGPAGETLWNFAEDLKGDQTVKITTLPVQGQWFAGKFPGATYAAVLVDGDELLGVFEVTDTSLLLRGVVSPEDGLFATRITYDPPLPILQFPLTGQSTWTAKATASGLLNGVISAWSEQLEVTGGGTGIVQTPMGNFPVLRLRTRLDKLVGLMITTYRSTVFVAECYGVVAKVDSKAGETKADFSKAAEVRRLAP